MFLSLYPNYAKENSPDHLEATLKIWCAAFDHVETWALQRSVIEWGATEKWFPALSEIRRKVDRITGDSIDFETWLEAWGKVETAMQRYRSHSAVHFTNYLTEHTVDIMGGIAKLAQADEIGQNANRAAFRDNYAALVTRAQEKPDFMQQCIAHQEQMADRRREQERTILDNKTSVKAVERNPRYFGSERSQEDEDQILGGLGYILDAGKWCLPSPEEAQASGCWRVRDDGPGDLAKFLAKLKVTQAAPSTDDKDPF